MTLQEKIASVPKLERIDSSIESCIKILEQELNKRKAEAPSFRNEFYRMKMSDAINKIKDDFNIMRKTEDKEQNKNNDGSNWWHSSHS